MKKIFILIGILITFSSCSEFRTSVRIEKTKSAIVDNDAILIYYSPEDNLPDSAEYIGDFNVKLKLDQYGFGSYKALKHNLINSIETQIKSAGGNLIMIDPINKNDKSEWVKGKIYYVEPLEKTDYNEFSLKKIWETRKPDSIEGIYEFELTSSNSNDDALWARYGILKLDSISYVMIYIRGFEEITQMWGINDLAHTWRTGDIYAYLQKTDNPYRYKSQVYSLNKSLDENATIKIDNGNLRISKSNSYNILMKVFPEASQYESLEYSLTGFAIDSNRFLTCYHGVKEAEYKIYIKGLNGNFDIKYEAVIEHVDKNNDIAVLRLIDSTFKSDFNLIPLTVQNKEIAEEVFVLGYPISSIMGEEIKITNGIINSTSGIAGNADSYQISAPIQHGNSGSPVFDKNGNLTGMVTSGISDANNVGYSLKYDAINKFLNKNSVKTFFDNENSIKDLSLTDKVKFLKKSIYLIEIIDTKRPQKKISKSTLRRR